MSSSSNLQSNSDGYGGDLPDSKEYSNDVQDHSPNRKSKPKRNFNAPEDLLDDRKRGPTEDILGPPRKSIAEKEDDYHARRHLRQLSPERQDPFNNTSKVEGNGRAYKDIMLEQQIVNVREEVQRKAERLRDEPKKKVKTEENSKTKYNSLSTDFSGNEKSEWEKNEGTKVASRWDTPGQGKRSSWDVTPLRFDMSATPSRLMGDTPTPGRIGTGTPGRYGETPTPRRFGKTRWDDKTPVAGSQTPTSYIGVTPTPSGAITPKINNSSKIDYQRIRMEKEVDERNRPLTDEELDQLLPSVGYEIVPPPESYKPIRSVGKNLTSAAGLAGATPALYSLPENTGRPYDLPKTPGSGPTSLPQIKPEDLGHFGALLNPVNEEDLTIEEQKERKILMLLLKIKNGTPPMRKSALRQITHNARDLGAGPLFNQILPLLLSTTLEEHERHLLVKVIDRVLYKLQDLVRPYVHKILVVIEPLLIDEDYYARVEGREIIANLAKAAGLATMIATMRPDIDHNDDFVRNITARAFAVVGSALGVPQLIPFLKAVCKSKKSWQARQTGIKIVQQLAILMGCAILPHLKSLVEIIEHGLKDEQQKVRTTTALGIAALAEASAPYGIDAFDSVLIPLWEGIRVHKGKVLAAFLKAIGFIIPIMNVEHAAEYTKEVMPIVIKEFQNHEEEMKKIVLKVVKQCVACEGIEPSYVKKTIFEEFFRCFWVRRMALDKRNLKQLVETTVEIACKLGGAEILNRIVPDLKDENEPFRKMVMESIQKIIESLGIADISNRLEMQLMDGILFAFQEQNTDESQVMLSGFGVIVMALGQRAQPYFSQICGIIQWRLNNKSPRVRQQAADLITKVAIAMKNCGEESRLGRLGVMLYECLGEEYPDVLGSILGGLKAIVNVVGMMKMTPPIKDLLPRLTPILKNRHEKVQENCIDLVGRIADRGAEFVSPKEWMRICFDLLELLKAHKKGIRRATVNTFGYIAKAIGPQDVLVTLMNNLKVQERQIRVCTTVAIAIVSETCGPFTILPALMNEYRVPELNVQNGVLKSFAFMFEYVGEMAKDYIYAVIPLLEDALTDRDLVHRQTAAAACKHLALGVHGLNCEDALVHLLNFVWPNIFETSPHVVTSVTEAFEGMRVSLGAGNLLLYIIQGLFHPARRIRNVYWKFYNLLYIGAQDSLTAFYPIMPNDSNNCYERTELLTIL